VFVNERTPSAYFLNSISYLDDLLELVKSAAGNALPLGGLCCAELLGYNEFFAALQQQKRLAFDIFDG
jgi:hypothetical protein